ncbi:MerR family transcriptional regulator [Shewanella algae]|uniref:MerR family transcriptional regulator n=1 Tax=Shewanella algae TaxID=38313 RepID=UPI0031F591AE
MPTDNIANLSIGEVARLTGVNPVTLRAWQRRFGLVIPQRTPKGHRLYSQEQVQQIREILSWLEQGVAISKVKPLLSGQTEKQLQQENEDDDWLKFSSSLTEAALSLSSARFGRLLDEFSALYPIALCCRRLRHWLQVLETQLDERLDGAFVRSWLESRLAHYVGARSEQLLRQKPRWQLLYLPLGKQPAWSEILLQLELITRGVSLLPLNIEEPLEGQGLQLLAHRLPLQGLLLLPPSQLPGSSVKALFQLARALDYPLILSGDYVAAHANAFEHYAKELAVTEKGAKKDRELVKSPVLCSSNAAILALLGQAESASKQPEDK